MLLFRDLPRPIRRSPPPIPHIIHPSLERPHLPPETASGYIQPFYHNTLSRQTHRQTERHMGYATGRKMSALICWYTSSTYCTRCGISSRGAVIVSWRGAHGARGVCGAVFRDTVFFTSIGKSGNTENQTYLYWIQKKQLVRWTLVVVISGGGSSSRSSREVKWWSWWRICSKKVFISDRLWCSMTTHRCSWRPSRHGYSNGPIKRSSHLSTTVIKLFKMNNADTVRQCQQFLNFEQYTHLRTEPQNSRLYFTCII